MLRRTLTLLGLSPFLFQFLSLHAATAQQNADFEARCNAPGVTLCAGFDNFDLDIKPFLDPVWNTNTFRGTLDTSQSASGAGSLKFEIPAFSGEDSSGNWSSRMGAQFGEGDKFYVQFRQRFSPEFLTADMGGDGWKQVLFYMDGGPSCGKIELATINAWQRGYPSMYTDCGNRGFQLNIGNNDFLNQWSADWPSKKHPTQLVECHYLNEKAPPVGGCFMYKANDWMTFYYEVEIGDWGQANSRVRAYAGYAGGPMYQFVNAENFRLDYNSDFTDHYSRILFTPFNTNKPSDRNHAAAYTWYDELIVSRNPIAAPGSGGVPTPTPTPPPGNPNQPTPIPRPSPIPPSRNTPSKSSKVSIEGKPIRIVYELERPGYVTVDVYDRTGHLVAELENVEKPTGFHEVRWDLQNNKGSTVSSGIYLFNFMLDGEHLKREKAVVVK